MNFSQDFRKSIAVSVAGHITVFVIFGFSFGNRYPAASFTSVSFWGQLLSKSQVSLPRPAGITTYAKEAMPQTYNSLSAEIKEHDSYYISRPALKPPVQLAASLEKTAYADKNPALTFSLRKKEPSMIFHPLLPYSFTLYFKDRQTAHVELMFNISSAPQKGSAVSIRRKISSGNLEVDLLVSRYIGRYLYMQQERFNPDTWQTVKIDLSAKE